MKRELTILHLYPAEMNLYGDHGNVLALKRRCEWRGIEAKVIELEPGQKLPTEVDIIFGGGGQDSGQKSIAADLARHGEKIGEWSKAGMPMLVVCGLYQLFGEYFKTIDGEILRGIEVFDVITVGGRERLIGNVVVESKKFGTIVGYENHSGQTTLSRFSAPLGRVVKGAGNNGEDGLEGAVRENSIGTYLHGPVLPKNPRLADFLISEALRRKYGGAELASLDDKIEYSAQKVAISRPR